VDHTDYGRGIDAAVQHYSGGIEQRLPGCLNDSFGTVLEDSIEAVVPAPAPSVECGRYNNCEFRHRAGTLRDAEIRL
jgi:hypothetical protein